MNLDLIELHFDLLPQCDLREAKAESCISLYVFLPQCFDFSLKKFKRNIIQILVVVVFF